MTVCLATVCEGGRSIVAVCDQKISSVAWGADQQATKLRPIGRAWWLMWAGNDVTKIPPIVDGIKNALQGAARSCEEVAQALGGAYHRQVTREAEGRCLRRYGLTMDEFLKKGSTYFPSLSFREIQRNIDQVQIECELLAFGFDSKQAPHIVKLWDGGTIDFYDPGNSSFAAVGSGQYRAESTLYFHKVSWMMPAARALYHACEAKFMAESAQGVGTSTVGIVVQKDGAVILLAPDHINKIRKLWEKQGMPRVPRSAERIVADVVNAALQEELSLFEQAKQEQKEGGSTSEEIGPPSASPI